MASTPSPSSVSSVAQPLIESSSETTSQRIRRSSGLDDATVRRSLRLTLVAGAFGLMWFAVVEGMPLTMLLEALGASSLLIGLLSTANLVTLCGQILGAYFAEKRPRRRGVWIAFVMTARVMWFLLPILVWLRPGGNVTTAALIVAIAAISGILNKGSAAPWWSWMADLIPSRERNRYWGIRQAVTMTTYLLFSALAGWILDRFPAEPEGHLHGFILVLVLAACFGVTDILIHLGVREPLPTPTPHNLPLWERLIRPLRERDFLLLTLGMGVWYMACGVVGPFGPVYLKRVFDVTYSDLAALVVSASLGTAAAGLVWIPFLNRFGNRGFALLMLAIAPLFAGAWFIIRSGTVDLPFFGSYRQPIVVHTVTGFFAGAVYSGVGLAQFGMLSSLAPREGRTMAMAVHWTVVGLLAALGPLLGGWLADVMTLHPLPWRILTGELWGFMHSLIFPHVILIWGVALPLIQRMTLPEGEKRIRTLFGRIFFFNPMRGIGQMRNAALLAPSDEDENGENDKGHAD